MIQQIRFGRQYQITPREKNGNINFAEVAHFLRSLNKQDKPLVITSDVQNLVAELKTLSELIKLPKEDFICKSIISKPDSKTIEVLTDDSRDETTDKNDFLKGFSKSITDGTRDEYVSSAIKQVSEAQKEDMKKQPYDDIFIVQNQLEKVDFPFDELQ